MKTICLDSTTGSWRLRWCDGQRGAMPHFLHNPPEKPYLDVMNLPKTIADDYDELKWIPASVPGEVHMDLLRAGMIDSPYTGTGALSCRWVEECYWFYRRVFDAGEAAAAACARLVLEGLDYGAAVYLNGEEIARHENAFTPCKIDVTGRLKETGNVLLVRLESGLFAACERPIRSYYTATMTIDVLLHKRNWLRKMQSQAAWDWAPRLMNVGINKPVYLEYDEAFLVDSWAVDTSLNDGLDRGTVRTRLFLHTWTDGVPLTVTVRLHGKTETFTLDAVPADGVIEHIAAVEQPALWWPVGYGDPNLYTVEVSVAAGERLLFSGSKRIGFRRVTVNQQPHPAGGRYFIFEINHAPVFMRGSNMVPMDMIPSTVTGERYRRLVDLALEANFNFLRIWGGGQYEDDAFYEYCDEKGVLVWQEFIAACAAIPADDEELSRSIENEARYHVRRLSSHPSLIVWCGNNELGMGREDGKPFHLGEDDVFYEELFPAILRAEDPDKYYQPTSPYSPDGDGANSDLSGDQHPWSVGFCNKDSREYEQMVCRFPNEGGILGPTSLKTMRACLRPGEGIHSFSWAVHDNMLENWMPGSSPDEDVRFWTGLSVREMTLEQYVLVGGFVQAEGLKRYIENFRRRKYTCSSAVFWMYNDCWPATRSWTIVDYYLRKTPSFHPVRRAFRPVTVVIAREGGHYTVYGVNDTLRDVDAVLRYGVFRTDGRYETDETIAVRLPANASTVLAAIDAEQIERVGRERAVTFACLLDGDGRTAAYTRYTSEKYADLQLYKPAISVTKVDGGYELSCPVFAMGVCLGLDGDEPVDDNLFDLLPGQAHRVTCEQPPAVQYCINDFFSKEEEPFAV